MRVPVTEDDIERIKKSGAEMFGCKPEDVKVVHVAPTFTPCDHDWPEDECGTNMNGCCTKCGMSFIRYIHTECP